MNDDENTYHDTINCSYIWEIIENVKNRVSSCCLVSKKCDFCKYFSCLTNKDFFVDLEEGGGAGGAVKNSSVSCVNETTCGGFGRTNVEKHVVNSSRREGGSQKNGEITCVKCNVKNADVVILPCGHGTYCNDCLEEWTETNKTCPTCNVVMTDVVQCI